MVIFRYFTKEVLVTLAALIIILLLIFLSNQFVGYLTRAAAGSIPGPIVLQLMLLEVPYIVGLLLPLGFFIAVLVAYGQMYVDNEITVLRACGFSQWQLVKITLLLGGVTAILVAVLVIWVTPTISKQRDHLLTGSGTASALVQTLMPGRFQTLPGGEYVVFVEQKSRDHSEAYDVFVARRSDKEIVPGVQAWDIMTAKHGYMEENLTTGEQFIVLEQGQSYQGVPGQQAMNVLHFDEYKARLPQVTPRLRRPERGAPLSDLWPMNNPDLQKAAELQWRLSLPIMTLILALLAVPLSRVNPRQGRFGKLLPAVILFILYANFIFLGRDWVRSGALSPLLGVWWVHGVMLLLALFLLAWPALQRQFYRVKHSL